MSDWVTKKPAQVRKDPSCFHSLLQTTVKLCMLGTQGNLLWRMFGTGRVRVGKATHNLVQPCSQTGTGSTGNLQAFATANIQKSKQAQIKTHLRLLSHQGALRKNSRKLKLISSSRG